MAKVLQYTLVKHKLRLWLLKTVTDTPLESAARKLYGTLVSSKGNMYDRQTVELMERVLQPDSNCIDVGAYRGEILKEMLRICPKGQHFAFEPVPENCEYVARKYPAATVHNLALSDTAGSTTFQHVVGRPARSGLKRVAYPDESQQVEEITVKVDTLDHVIPKEIAIDFIKIDVEGAELQVLRGARKLIAAYRPVIVFEHELEKAQHYGTKPEAMYDFLVKEMGMKVSLMERYARQEPSLKRSEFANVVRENSDFYFIAYAA